MDDGKPVTIARLKRNRLLFDKEALYSILMREEYRQKDVVVISVAGAFRLGKSFLLNLMLRYLERQGRPGWMGERGEPLRGFQWRNGCEKHSSGVVVWSKLFPIEIDSGNEIYVMLMDTEGLYGCSSSIENDASIFALSTLLSSIQLFNVSQTIQENDLMYLEMFSEYGKRAASQMNFDIPYQKLMFLVRDWSYPYDFHYGSKGGEEYMNRCLAVRQGQHRDHKSMRRNIRACFPEIGCFLMPHPGLKASTSHNFQGKVEDISEDFKDPLVELMESLFTPNSLAEKLDDIPTAEHLYYYFQKCETIFNSNEVPLMESIFVFNGHIDNAVARDRVSKYYQREMNKICEDRPFMSKESMKKEHEVIKSKAIELFSEMKKLGDKEIKDIYEEYLIQDIDYRFNKMWKEWGFGISRTTFLAAFAVSIYFLIQMLQRMNYKNLMV